MTETTDSPRQPYPPEFALTPESALPAGGEEAAPAAQPDTAKLFLRELVETIVLSVVIFLLIRQGIQNYRIESISMEPNFHEGQFVLVNKLAYKLGQPERGDVIVFHNPERPEEDFIKRVIGLPGDTIEFRDNQVFVNGLQLTEPYINAPTLGEGSGPIVVEPDHLFVMGDNRPNSRDSRRFGRLPMDLVVGKAWVRVWPFSQWTVVSHPDLMTGAAAAP